MDSYPRETVEFKGVVVTIDGEPVVDDVEFAVTTGAARPTSWIAPVSLDGELGIMIEDFTPGRYRVWAKVSDDPEIPVVECGQFDVT